MTHPRRGEPHTCICRKCRPDLFPPITDARTSPGHYAMRFGDWRACVYLFGGKLRDVMEVMEGEWAVRVRLPGHPCCGGGESDGWCQTVHRGPFEVRQYKGEG